MTLEITAVEKSFREVRVLHEISFIVREGEFVSIVGPSGCGKTTLLRLIGGLLEPTSGTVTLDGKATRNARQDGRFGFLFQRPVLLPWRTIAENVRLPLELGRNGRIHQTPEDALRFVGLSEFANRYPRELSGGMQQKAALARVLVFGPSVLLMDEPLASLDEISRELISLDFLDIVSRAKATVLMVTHSLQEATLLSDRILVLTGRPGRIRDVVHVRLPKPRTWRLANESYFEETTAWIRMLLHDESGR